MPNVTVNIVFDSIEQARSFFGQPPAAAPQQSVQPVASIAVSPPSAPTGLSSVSTPSPTIAPQTTASAAAPSGAPEDNVKLVHAEVNELIKRTPSGAGAVKSKEILLKHGFTRIRDINDAAKAQAIIADLRAA